MPGLIQEADTSPLEYTASVGGEFAHVHRAALIVRDLLRTRLFYPPALPATRTLAGFSSGEVLLRPFSRPAEVKPVSALSFAGCAFGEEPTRDHENEDCDRYVLHDVMVERRQKEVAEDHGHCHCDHGNFEQIISKFRGAFCTAPNIKGLFPLAA